MSTANDNIRDALIRHHIALQRLSAGMSEEAVRILDRTEAALAADIRRALQDGATTQGSAGIRKMQRLEDAVRAIRTDAIVDLGGGFRDDAVDLVRHEAEFTATNLDVHAPVVLDLTLPSAATLTSLVDRSPFEGSLLNDWFERTAEADLARIMDGVKVGLTRGLSIDDIVRGVVGSSDFNGTDGVTQMTRNQVSSLVRTAVNAFSNRARDAVVEANADILEWERYTATLDSRTSPRCRALDGKLFKVGEGPKPPQHFGCRSIRVPALSFEAIGDRPMKTATEKQLVREFADREGIDAIKRSDIERGLKGEFDKYARQRVRELTGTVSADTTYQAFLKRQSASFQDEILGKTKARLFRDGGLSLDKFVTKTGTELNLKQMATRERAAFKKAGIDPDKYTVD